MQTTDTMSTADSNKAPRGAVNPADADVDDKGGGCADKAESRDQFDEEAARATEAALLPGVAHMERVRAQLTTKDRWLLFGTMFLAAYAYNLDSTMRSTFVAYAAASYAEHSLLSTINVIRGVIAAAAQPVAAKLADLVGRLEVFLAAVAFYVVGTIIQAGGRSLEALAVGALFQQIGYAVSILVMEIVIADVVALRSRTLYLFLPNAPCLVNAWVSGSITAAFMTHSTWRWGIGCYGIIYPACILPFVLTLWCLGRRASRAAAAEGRAEPVSLRRGRSWTALARDLFWKLDLLGLLLLTTALAMLLIPMTLAGGATRQWKTAGILTPIVLGFLLACAFVFAEARVPHPVMPPALLRERSVWAGLGVAVFTPFVWACQGDYLYTVLVVGYDLSVAAATRISSVYSFCEIVAGLAVGAAVYRMRRVRPVALASVALFFVGLGVMLHFRGGAHNSSRAGVVAGQVLLGAATAGFAFPNAVAAQAMTKHEDIAVLTSLWLTCNSVGMALGECVSGAIWTQTLYDQLQKDLAPINATLASSVYASPLYVVPYFPVGTPERTAIIESYKHVQRLLLISSLCLTVPILGFTLCLRNTKLKGYFYGSSASRNSR